MTMKAVLFEQFGPPSVLKLVTDYPKPTRKAGEVLVQIYATSINPIDWKTRSGKLPKFLVTKPKVLGGDLSGIVVESDENSKFPPGSRVYGCTTGFRMWESTGCYAQFYSTPESHLAVLPTNISLIDGGALPLACLTAWQCLDAANLKTEGQRVLIHAGAGGVGSMCIQLAKQRKLHVITTCSTRNIQFVKDLGADEVIDYTTQKFEDVLKDAPVDAVIDLVAGDVEIRSYRVLKKSGTLVSALSMGFKSITSKILHVFGASPNFKLVMASPNGEQLEKCAALIEKGAVKVIIDKKMPLEEAAEGHAYMEKGHARGKVVLVVKEEN